MTTIPDCLRARWYDDLSLCEWLLVVVLVGGVVYTLARLFVLHPLPMLLGVIAWNWLLKRWPGTDPPILLNLSRRKD